MQRKIRMGSREDAKTRREKALYRFGTLLTFSVLRVFASSSENLLCVSVVKGF